MDDVYTMTRSIYFVWGFLLFLGMIHWGLQDLLLSRKCGHRHVTPEHHVWAAASLAGIFVLLVSIGEIFLMHAPGGFRVFLPGIFLLFVNVALILGRRRIKSHRKSIERGLPCEELEP